MAELYYLLLGSNLGNREVNLNQAVNLLKERVGWLSKASSLYETAAWGKTDQPDFLNQAICLISDEKPENILDKALQIEAELGRERIEHWGSRIIDIDLLFAGDRVVNNQRLILPHPQIQNRRFVLVPLNEIAPEFYHPILNKKVKELLENCPDTLEVRKHNL